MSEFRRGMTLRDKTSGFTGIATTKVLNMSGVIQWTLQPYDSAGVSIPTPYSIDESVLEHVKEKEELKFPECEPVTIKLGSHVQDIVTGYEGIATERHESQNGCVYYAIMARVKKEKDGSVSKIDGCLLEQKRLKIINTNTEAVAIASKNEQDQIEADIAKKVRPGNMLARPMQRC